MSFIRCHDLKTLFKSLTLLTTSLKFTLPSHFCSNLLLDLSLLFSSDGIQRNLSRSPRDIAQAHARLIMVSSLKSRERQRSKAKIIAKLSPKKTHLESLPKVEVAHRSTARTKARAPR